MVCGSKLESGQVKTFTSKILGQKHTHDPVKLKKVKLNYWIRDTNRNHNLFKTIIWYGLKIESISFIYS